MDIKLIKERIEKQQDFSGVVSVDGEKINLFQGSFGYLDRSNLIANNVNTKFGIASGCKLFTAIAICQLVQAGKLTFDTLLSQALDIPLKNFDPNISIHHLLTHSSGVPDYFDEEVMDDFSELWIDRPMYSIKSLQDFLPMFKDSSMEFTPGTKFKYNNAGFILLGLVVEQQTGISFNQYVNNHIFKQLNMLESGYFSFDNLPPNTALGYLKDESGDWRSNIYSLPIIGGSDGGAYTTSGDLAKLWRALLNYEILDEKVTNEMLRSHIHDSDNTYYGYGIWMIKDKDEIIKYFIMGFDPGVSMVSSFYPKNNVIVSILGNTEYGTWSISKDIHILLK